MFFPRKKPFSLIQTLAKPYILCLFIYTGTKAAHQATKDSLLDITVSATHYFFAYNIAFTNGSYALGPTVTVNSEGTIAFQFGFLYDFKPYYYYVKRRNNYGMFYYAPVKHLNLFAPLLLRYNFLKRKKITLYGTAGIMLGGRNTLTKENKPVKTGYFNVACGPGILYRFTKRFTASVYPTMRYNSGDFNPGTIVDISIVF